MSFHSHAVRRILNHRRPLLIAAIVLVAVATLYERRFDLYMIGVADMHDLPLDSSGYRIESLPFNYNASFARERMIYFVDRNGQVFVLDESDPKPERRLLGDCGVIEPRSIFVSSHGTIFVGGNTQALMRSQDGGASWVKSMDLGVWRMDEDEESGRLFFGNYTPRDLPDYQAELYASRDEGQSWRNLFRDSALDHMHTVRFDPLHHRLYFAAGDGPTRGQAFSDDGGTHWRWLAAGRGEGHTDAAFTEHHVVWGSDDSYGKILLADRSHPEAGRPVLFARRHQVWWVVAQDHQIYAGTFSDQAKSRSGAFLVASDDQGLHWKKLMEIGVAGPTLKSFDGESRRLSAGGWLYFRDSQRHSYRVRRETGSKVTSASN